MTLASTSKNAAVTIPVLANDSDPDGDVLSIGSSINKCTAIISGTKRAVHTTNNFLGTAIIGYSITEWFQWHQLRAHLCYSDQPRAGADGGERFLVAPRRTPPSRSGAGE